MNQATLTISAVQKFQDFISSLVESGRSLYEKVEHPSALLVKWDGWIPGIRNAIRKWNRVMYGPKAMVEEGMEEIRENMAFVMEHVPDARMRMPEIPVVTTLRWLPSDSAFKMADVDEMVEEERVHFFRKKWAEFRDLVEWCWQQERPSCTLGLILNVFQTDHYVTYLDHQWWEQGCAGGDQYPVLFWKAMNKNLFNSAQDNAVREEDERKRKEDLVKQEIKERQAEVEQAEHDYNRFLEERKEIMREKKWEYEHERRHQERETEWEALVELFNERMGRLGGEKRGLPMDARIEVQERPLKRQRL